jgi:hypothetical protein
VLAVGQRMSHVLSAGVELLVQPVELFVRAGKLVSGPTYLFGRVPLLDGHVGHDLRGQQRVAVAGADGLGRDDLLATRDVGDDLGPQTALGASANGDDALDAPPAASIVSMFWRTPKPVASSAAR